MKSIILLAMSILNQNMNLNKEGMQFLVEDDSGLEIKDCRSQLEPVVRYFLKDKECTDEVDILMLCTRPTLEEFIPNDKSKYVNKKGIELDKVSAVSFLKERIEECSEKKCKKIVYKVFPLYREEGEVPVGLDAEIVLDKNSYEPDYLYGMRSVITEIRHAVNENNKEEKSTPFYIVSHGGLRDVVLSLNAIISLMDGEGIRPGKICGTNTSNHTIEDQRASFDIFRFVSGMQDFLNVGSVETLQNYYKESVYLYSSDKEDAEEFNKKLLDAMNKVSIGVQYSNPESYISGLDDLKKVLDTDVDDKFEKTSLGIFKDTIKKDFGVLLDPEKRTEVDMVERCINKKQYQQALTFLESAFPEFYRKNNIISFSSDPGINIEKFNNFFKKHIHLKDRDNSPNKIIEDFFTELEKRDEPNGVLNDSDDWKENLEEELNKHLEYMEKVNSSNDSDSKIVIGSIYSFTTDIFPVFKMHKVLKEIRNIFSHGKVENRPNITKLDKYMRAYLKALRNLVEKSKVEKF